jgi:hypothetical protein
VLQDGGWCGALQQGAEERVRASADGYERVAHLHTQPRTHRGGCADPKVGQGRGHPPLHPHRRAPAAPLVARKACQPVQPTGAHCCRTECCPQTFACACALPQLAAPLLAVLGCHVHSPRTRLLQAEHMHALTKGSLCLQRFRCARHCSSAVPCNSNRSKAEVLHQRRSPQF